MFKSRVNLLSTVPCPEMALNKTCVFNSCIYSHTLDDTQTNIKTNTNNKTDNFSNTESTEKQTQQLNPQKQQKEGLGLDRPTSQSKRSADEHISYKHIDDNNDSVVGPAKRVKHEHTSSSGISTTSNNSRSSSTTNSTTGPSKNAPPKMFSVSSMISANSSRKFHDTTSIKGGIEKGGNSSSAGSTDLPKKPVAKAQSLVTLSTQTTSSPALNSSLTSSPSSASTSTSTSPASASLDANKPDAVSLAPKTVVPFSPAPHPQRHQFIKLIYAELVKRKTKRPRATAVEQEYEIAQKSSKATYGMLIKNHIVKLKKGELVGELAQQAHDKMKAEKLKKQIDEMLKTFVHPKTVLNSNGFLTEPIVASNKPFTEIQCARCAKTVDPRNVLNSGQCKYHWGRLVKVGSIRQYSCCNVQQGAGSGCEISPSHVFRTTDKDILESYIPFMNTPDNKNSSSTLYAAAIDCEMGYTSHGYEMIRLTVVDWTTEKTVLDKTVFPYGTVIDLNTRFSGIQDINQGTTVDGKHYPTVSFKQVRDEFFKLVSSSTILIGHGLDNDLEVLRLIHPNIVDTSVLYQTERFKPALKTLTQAYLKREIQSGEHDSAEDAIASMDLVKAKAKSLV